IKWTRLSCRTFGANAVRLQLHALAYNLANFLRTLATPEPMSDWSLTTLKEKLTKIGAKVVSHGPLHRLPDGRGRHPTANVPRDFAAHRGTAAAATTSASMRCSTVMRSRVTDGMSASECQGKRPDQIPLGRSGMSGTIHPLASLASSQFRKRLPSTSV